MKKLLLLLLLLPATTGCDPPCLKGDWHTAGSHRPECAK